MAGKRNIAGKRKLDQKTILSLISKNPPEARGKNGLKVSDGAGLYLHLIFRIAL